ncbi:MAG: hypothetical protein GOMPHAMPRED_004457 [Gomphillus americanus]|uniref:Uncharacterized protein n=1 Tax=Gomphillus americanus TaxID=1940652 RepID=A0A8H3ITV6_9LECA|nr:MAG: hypothetical protein GOMPHAMPRED_004457 [Gomphillus americanus]
MCFGRKYKRWTKYTTYYLKDPPQESPPQPAEEPKKEEADKKPEEQPDRRIFVQPNDIFYREGTREKQKEQIKMSQDKTKSNKRKKVEEEPKDRHINVFNPVFYKAENPLTAPVINFPIPGAPPSQNGMPTAQSHLQFMPYRPCSEDQFWCREFDGGWSLRTATEINETCGPGNWTMGKAGWPYFTRIPPSA